MDVRDMDFSDEMLPVRLQEKDMKQQMLEKEVAELKLKLYKLSESYMSLYDGDDIKIDQAMEIMEKEGFVGSDGFWIDEND